MGLSSTTSRSSKPESPQLLQPLAINGEMAASTPTDDPRLRVFAYAVAEKAWLYVPLVDTLMAAKERFRLQLRPAELARELPGSVVEEVAEALDALEAWGNVTRFYDTTAPETLGEFYSKRFLYQLTEAGVAAHEGIRAVRRAGLDSGRLSGVLLPGIIERLAAISVEAGSGHPDDARVYHLLVDLFASFAELADNAARYMNDLAQETSEIAGDDESFAAYKAAVFTYLDEFVARLAATVPQIADAITNLDPQIDDLIGLAAKTDTAPVRTGTDDGLRSSFASRWSGVRAWFVAQGTEPPIATSLRMAMLDALNRILAAVGRLHEQHLRRVTREADFTQLARWFSTATPEEAPLLWDRAFGLYPARHFAEAAGDEESERGASFWDVAAVEVAPRLRATGTRAAPGRPGQGADYTAAKTAGLARIRSAQRQAGLAMARLARRTPTRLSHLGKLDGEELAQLLEVFDAALSARPGTDGTRCASTPLVGITMRPVPGTRQAVIVTPAGTLICADQAIHIWLAGETRAEAVG